MKDDYSLNLNIRVILNPGSSVVIMINGQLESRITEDIPTTRAELKHFLATKQIRHVTCGGRHLSIRYDLVTDKCVVKQHGVSLEKLPAPKESA